jgi:hypothetical protein
MSNAKRIKKVRKILRQNFDDLLKNTKTMPLLDRIILCKELLFRTKKTNLRVINKK